MKSKEIDLGPCINKTQLTLSTLGASFGLGNIWRYPFIAYINGGGAFLIPYWTCVFVVALPLMYLEMTIGQFSSLSPTSLFKEMCPPLKGIGYTMVIETMVLSVYLNVIVAKAIYYLSVSFSQGGLPWDRCEDNWNTLTCYSSKIMKDCYKTNGSYILGHCLMEGDDISSYLKSRQEQNPDFFTFPNISWCNTLCDLYKTVEAKYDHVVNESDVSNNTDDIKTQVRDQFWLKFGYGDSKCYEVMLNGTDTNCSDVTVNKAYLPTLDVINETQRWLIENSNSLRLAAEEYHDAFVTGGNTKVTNILPTTLKTHLVTSLAVSWCICFVFLTRGMHNTGKAMYVPFIFSQVGIMIFFLYGLSLKGAKTGILYYILPNFKEMGNPKIWIAAVSQAFLSCNVCLGQTINMANFNKFNNNVVSDSLLVILGNSLCTIIIGFSVFSILGFLAEQQQLQVGEVTQSSIGLIFVVFPTAITLMPMPTISSAIFFLIVIVVGISGQLVSFTTINSAAVDAYPSLNQSKLRRLCLISSYCIMMFLFGLICCTNAGGVWIQIMDTYMVSYVIIIVGLVEAAGITFLYGKDMLSEYADTHSNFLRHFSWLKEGMFLIFVDTDRMITFNKHYAKMRRCWKRYIAYAFYFVIPWLLLCVVVLTYIYWQRIPGEPIRLTFLYSMLYFLCVLPIPMFFLLAVYKPERGMKFIPSARWIPAVNNRRGNGSETLEWMQSNAKRVYGSTQESDGVSELPSYNDSESVNELKITTSDTSTPPVVITPAEDGPSDTKPALCERCAAPSLHVCPVHNIRRKKSLSNALSASYMSALDYYPCIRTTLLDQSGVKRKK